jgi:hypothetical protein
LNGYRRSSGAFPHRCARQRSPDAICETLPSRLLRKGCEYPGTDDRGITAELPTDFGEGEEVTARIAVREEPSPRRPTHTDGRIVEVGDRLL